MATNSEKNSHIDLEAIRSDIAALTMNVGNLVHQLSNAQAGMAKTTEKAAKAAAGIGADMWKGAAHLASAAASAVSWPSRRRRYWSEAKMILRWLMSQVGPAGGASVIVHVPVGAGSALSSSFMANRDPPRPTAAAA